MAGRCLERMVYAMNEGCQSVLELERVMIAKRQYLIDLRQLRMELRTKIEDAEEDFRQASHAYNVAVHRNRRDAPCSVTTSS